VPPYAILAITFTNKAAGEMKSRIAAAIGRPIHDFGRLEHPYPTICTFHSLCLRILKHYASTLGLSPNFTIYDSHDQQKLIKLAIKECGKDEKQFQASNLQHTISTAKNKLQGPQAFSQAAGGFVEREVAGIYTKYQELLKKNSAMDFDDLLYYTAMAFRDHADVLSQLQDRFEYILIDEYQDTNHAQYVIAHALALKNRNICVVGDPDQSIYAWRGADIRNILDFETDYPDARTVRLEQNYRSTKRILKIASQLISHNKDRKKKDLWTENEDGAKAQVYVCTDDREEAMLVTEALKQLHEKQNVQWNQMAIFYRINSMSRVMEDALRRANVPYQIARGVEFYNRAEIKDVMAYLKVIANPNDEVSLTRIVNVPARGLGDTSLRVLQTYAIGNHMTLLSAMTQAERISGLQKKAAAAAKKLAGLFADWTRKAFGAVTAPAEAGSTLIPASAGEAMVPAEFAAVASPAASVSVQAILEAVVKQSGLEASYKKSDSSDVEGSEMDNINELISSAAQFDAENPEANLRSYLDQVSLISDVDHLGDGGAVTLMTLHAAKGLEFPVVAIIGMEHGILPHQRADQDAQQMEEERRLCFVGITRAQKLVLLSRAKQRMIRGQIEPGIASPFLTEMPQSEMDINDYSQMGGGSRSGGGGGYQWPGAGRSQAGAEGEIKSPYKPDQRVRHPRFGLGTIVEASPMGGETRLVVQFDEAGKKTLVASFARLEIQS
jgi:DNA helicase II / ATP-dependent DNA helicase PcrA